MSRLLASRLLAREWWSDARHYQIAALSTLLIFNLGWLDFGARPLNSALAIGAALATQASAHALIRAADFDPRSPLITGLSLSLLLRADEPWLHALAGVIAHRLEVRAARRRQAHLEPGGFRHRRAAAHVAPACGFRPASGARPSGWPRFVLLRHPGAARRAPLRCGDFLPRQSCRAAVRARLVARRPAGHSDASAAERLAADLLVLHDLGSAHHADSRLGRFIFALSVALLGALFDVLHADAAGALRRADRAVPAHPSHRQSPSGGTVLLDARRPCREHRNDPRSPSSSEVDRRARGHPAHRHARRPAAAFCGFYVAKADSKLFNKSSKVVLSRDGQTPPSPWRATTRASRRNSPSSFRCRPSSSESRSAWSR